MSKDKNQQIPGGIPVEPDNWPAWRHLLSVTERINWAAKQDHGDLKTICDCLESIEVALEPIADPVSNLKEYTTLNLCRSLKRFLHGWHSLPK